MTLPASSDPILERSRDFYIESLYISVQNTLFDIPRFYFERSCNLVSILSPRPREKYGLGWSKERPIILPADDITPEDFAVFLRYKLTNLHAYADGFRWDLDITSNVLRWEYILKVATLLGFQNERRCAISSLDSILVDSYGHEKESGTVKRIRIARSYLIEEWLLRGYTTLVRRKKTLNEAEIVALGYPAAIMLLKMRDREYKARSKDSIQRKLRKYVQEELSTSYMVRGFRERLAIGNTNAVVDNSDDSDNVNPEIVRVHSPGYFVARTCNVLFRVPREVLIRGPFLISGVPFNKSEWWTPKNWFAGQPVEQEAAATDNEHALLLEDVVPGEFCVLLHAIWETMDLLPLVDELAPKIEQDSTYWITVLKLTTKWDMVNTRALAIERLSPLLNEHTRGSEIAQVILAREFKVRKWLMEAYWSIVNREQMITRDEREVLGMEDTFRLMELRDAHYRGVEAVRVTALVPVRFGQSVAWDESSLEKDLSWKFREISLEEVERKFPEVEEHDGTISTVTNGEDGDQTHESR